MSHRDMKEELTCPICMELFQQPRRLPCGHSYCHVCLKTMLDRSTELHGLYCSRPLVCPECREEVNVDNGHGVEVIPRDFKLSKLVDLFKFMRKNDSSDSSDDDLQPYKTAATLMADPLRAAAPLFAGGNAESVPQSGASLYVQSSYPVTSDDGQLTQSQQPSSCIPTGRTSAAVITDSSAVHISATVPNNTSAASSSQTSATSTVQTSVTSIALTSVASTGLAATSTALTSAAHTTALTSATSVPLTSAASATHTAALTPSTSAALLSATHTSASIIDPQENPSSNHFVSESRNVPADAVLISNPSSSSIFRPHPDTVTISSAREVDHLEPHMTGDIRDTTTTTYQIDHGAGLEQAPSLTENVVQTTPGQNCSQTMSNAELLLDRSVSFDRVYEEQLNPSFQLGAVGGMSAEDERHPADLLDRQARPHFHYNPQTSSTVEETYSSQRISPALNSEAYNAGRVTRDSGNKRESEGSSGSTQYPALKSQQKVRDAEVNRKLAGRFTFDDGSSSSSHSSQSDRKVGQQGSSGKPKRWLMTQFLRSIILSDSESTDDSDDGEISGGDAAAHATRDTAVKNIRAGPCTDQSLYHVSDPPQGNRLSDALQSQSSSKDCVPRGGGRNMDREPSRVSECVPTSDRRKDMGNQSSRASFPSIEVDSTVPKALYSSFTQAESQPHSRGKQTGQRHIRGLDQTIGDQPLVGSPPTFYDNLNVISCAVGHGTKNNMDNQSALHSNVERPRVLFRDPDFNPCNQPRSIDLATTDSQIGSLYDNHNNDHMRARQRSARSHHGNISTRNPVTDIEDLKTGFEHVHTDGGSESLYGQNQVRNMRESDSHTESSHGSLHGDNRLLLSCHTHDDVGAGLVSLYDNLGSPVCTGHFQDSGLVLSDCVRSNGRRELSLGSDLNTANTNDDEGCGRDQRHGSHQPLDTAVGADDEGCGRDQRHGSHQPLDTAVGADDELCYVDNYFDQYSELFQGGRVPAQPSGVVLTEDEADAGGDGESAVSATVDGGSGRQTNIQTGVNACVDNSSTKDVCSSGAVSYRRDDDDSPQQQNKNRPGARLRKFFTSLLSLSSSSDDGDDESSSSESSGW